MSRQIEQPDSLEAQQAAAQWWARLREVQGNDALVPWQEWNHADPRHAEAFERIAELGIQLTELDLASKARLVDEFVTSRPAAATSKLPWLAAAAVLLMAGTGGVMWWQGQDKPENLAQYASPIGTNRDVVLSDHSRVELGGASAVATRITAHERVVELQRGEANFKVAHDSSRPFLVSAGRLCVRATGTAFDVRRVGDRVSVVVSEGKVRIGDIRDINSGSSSNAVEATAGQEVIYDPSAAGLAFASVDPAKALAWQEGRLEYVDEPLESVVADLNRYSRQPVRIADPAVAKMVYSGTIQIAHFEGWVNGLPYVFPLKVVRSASAIVLDARR